MLGKLRINRPAVPEGVAHLPGEAEHLSGTLKLHSRAGHAGNYIVSA